MTTIQTATKDKAPQPSRGTNGEAAKSKPPSAPMPPEAEALPFDLDALPDGALAALAVAVPHTIAARQAKREADLFAEFTERARALGVSPARLAAALAGKTGARVRPNSGTDDGRSEVKPKYRNPDNPAQLWTGRGKPPPWITLGDECSPRGTRLPLAKFRIPEDEV